MARPLFSDLGPWAYNLSALRLRWKRSLANTIRVRRGIIATAKQESSLPVTVYKHNSLIRRRLGNVDMDLQEGKARSLAIAAPLVDGLVIEPGQSFSLWHLVGKPSPRRGFGEGLIIANGGPSRGLGGGLCQFSNLIHWMVLHTPLEVTEHHHHTELDLFPDFNRQIPFGTGTSIAHNYLDYRFTNPTDATFQLRVWVDGEHLRGEIRANRKLDFKWHIKETDAYYYRATNLKTGEPEVRRHNAIWRETRCKRTGNITERVLVQENDALTCYDESHITAEILPAKPQAGTALQAA